MSEIRDESSPRHRLAFEPWFGFVDPPGLSSTEVSRRRYRSAGPVPQTDLEPEAIGKRRDRQRESLDRSWT